MVRFGIIGTNTITEELLKAGADHPDFAVTAVYSRKEETARPFADAHGVENIFTDLEAMAQSDLIDAVYIASPNALHAEQAILFLSHKKHVLCEKAFASHTREVTAMVETARANGVVLMEAMKPTLSPNFARIREHLSTLGTIRRVFTNYCQYSSRYDAYKAGTVLNAFKPELSNGALMDIGVYCLYPISVLFGRPDQVKANAYMLESGVDGEGSILLSYPDKEAVVMYSKITRSQLPSEIQGEAGTMIIDRINVPEKVEIHYLDGRIEDISVSVDKHTMWYELDEFIRLVHEGKQQSAINSWEHSLMTMEIMEEARKQIGLVFPADKSRTY